ncbi:MBL fold metallo-hydrolase [Solibacillus sp. FSL W7-1324]|uniref:MBL fold metallo-hydrolase n=1 Tax=Solibacillus sp. FSL W7-1324 TaxID=2921701 RepID=UPI0030FB6E82
MRQFENEQLTVFQSVLYQTTSAVVKTKDALIVTDPNWLPNEVAEIKAYIESVIEDRKLYIIYTHSDYDHIIAAGAFPNATTIASEAFVNKINKEEVLEQIRQFDAQYYIERDYPVIYPQIDIVIKEDGQTVELQDVTCSFYRSPGHTADGLFTVVEPYGILLAGDYLSNVEFPFIEDYEAYLATIQKVQTIISHKKIEVLVPGHGTTTNNKNEIQKRIDESLLYLNNLSADCVDETELQKLYPFYKGLKDMHKLNKETVKNSHRI